MTGGSSTAAARPTCLLTIESTCDETAAAVIDGGRNVLGSAVASQDELHVRYGGVVPELAARAHVERLLPVIDAALSRAGKTLAEVTAVAVAVRPGLAGSLLAGLAAAKSLALALDAPLIAVDHLQAHVYACRLAAGRDVFPCTGLVVSGGHTSLYRCRDPLDFELLGGTIDDAAGEAFDKVASLLGLPYPGGPAIERAAQGGDPARYRFPRTFLHEPARLAFSFSGLKTAVRYALAPPQATADELRAAAARLTPSQLADLAASFQAAVVDVLVAKCLHALRDTGLTTLCVGGGVAANAALRSALTAAAAEWGCELHIAPPRLCTDNAVMGAIALERLRAGLVEGLDLDVEPGLQRGPRAGAANSPSSRRS